MWEASRDNEKLSKVKLLGANAWSQSSFGDYRYDFPKTNARQVSEI